MPFLLNGSILALVFIVRRKTWKKKPQYFLDDALKKKKMKIRYHTLIETYSNSSFSNDVVDSVGCSIHFGSLQYGCCFRDRRSRQMAVY